MAKAIEQSRKLESSSWDDAWSGLYPNEPSQDEIEQELKILSTKVSRIIGGGSIEILIKKLMFQDKIDGHIIRPSLDSRHTHFLTKIKKVLGDTAQNFLGSYIDGSGKSNTCYYLPERETQLMVMSEI